MEIQKKSIGDSVFGYPKKISFSDDFSSYYLEKKDIFSRSFAPFLLSRGKRSAMFFTEDSKRYKTNQNTLFLQKSFRFNTRTLFDSAYSQFELKKPCDAFPSFLGKYSAWRIRRSFFGLRSKVENVAEKASFSISPVRALNFSIVGAILFGMISMSLIYRYLGQGAHADIGSHDKTSTSIEGQFLASNSIFSGEFLQEDPKNTHYIESELVVAPLPIAEQKPKEEIEKLEKNEAFAKNAKNMTQGYPIERMLPYILEQDKEVAAYLMAIAKKESNWGKRVPVLNGEDCFNYWGYRGIRESMGTGGHTCFNDPKDAVQTVAKRLKKLIQEENMTTAKDLVVWKCGYSCAGHGKSDVNKWISDVALYYDKLKKTNKS